MATDQLSALPQAHRSATLPPPAGGFLASPLGMLVAIPLLIMLTGGIAIGVSQSLMRRGALEQADQTFRASANNAAQRAQNILAQSGPVLDGIRSWAENHRLDDDPATARALLGIIDGRAGIYQAYIALPDGSFRAVSQEEGNRNFISVVPGGHRRVFAITADGSLLSTSDEPGAGFDPRQRPWYRLAQEQGRRSWTDPYVFARSGLPGITCADVLPGPSRAVVAIDFNLVSLGDAAATPGMQHLIHHVLFTADHTIIALPEDWRGAAPRGKLLKPGDVHVPEVDAFFASLASAPMQDPFVFTVAGQEQGGIQMPISLPNGPTWELGQVMSRRLLLGHADAAMRWSLILGAVTMAIGVGVAAWFAKHLARSRRETAEQRARAKAAEAQLAEIGAYRLIRKLGEGGMGEVWLGEHRMLARPAAIKRITTSKLGDGDSELVETARVRFAQEARITAALRSRNTIELYDYGVAPDGSFYYVMELLDGMDLRELVTKFGPLPAGRAVQLLIQACNSLAEAHDHGLVHRDIKPENLYTCRRADEVDVLKVLDFGIVAVHRKALAVNVTQAGYIQGTPACMAPEQARGEALDGRADLYALGCCAYWLLTGKDVFDCDDQLGMVLHHINDEPERPSVRIGRDLPGDLENLVLQCLSKHREQRPEHARALAEALRAVAIPEAERWSEGRAKSWWSDHVPPKGTGLFEKAAGMERTVAVAAPA